MPISTEETARIASLARIKLDGVDIGAVSEALPAILEYVGQLAVADTTGVEPLAIAVEVGSPLRRDVTREPLVRDAVLAAAPSECNSFFEVPQILDPS